MTGAEADRTGLRFTCDIARAVGGRNLRES